ncbi:NlpC/P60 family protein [Gelidibacter japonicus]|uniref:C40 family peptidase n=1 Tax=Gelidibacter japonicus TaxID=1962232 RepID=UPI00201FF4B6|nr:NlpC/P60 family protein [Gelidibacter japonicus]MCL8007846.1 NlpC/P60 family protein [Gelidibacter japonicus]
MNLLKRIHLFSLLGILILASCNESNNKKEDNIAEAYIADIKQEFAPDKRVALFDIDVEKLEGNYILRGESNLPDAVSALKQKLDAESISYTDSIQVLPVKEDGKSRGLVKISVANLRGKGTHSAELVTQAMLGTPLTILKHTPGWSLIQTPEGYISWVDNGGIVSLTDEEFTDWKAADKLIYLNSYGASYVNPDTKSQVVSDLVAGNIIEVVGERNGFYEIKYPDGKKAFIEKEKAKPYLEWVASVDQSEEDLVASAKKMMGSPYLWGGTSPKGMDCSGFTKTVFFLNGLIIPRDASQQIHTGELVDSTKNFENLVPGDLLFFGKKATDTSKERVVHVGMWIGDNKFIHAMGDVHISNMDTTADDFDKYNYDRYLRTKRIHDQKGPGLTYLAETDIFMDKSEAQPLKK